MVDGSRRPFDYVVIDCDGGGHLLVLGFGGAKKEEKKKKKKEKAIGRYGTR